MTFFAGALLGGVLRGQNARRGGGGDDKARPGHHLRTFENSPKPETILKPIEALNQPEPTIQKHHKPQTL